MTAGPLLAWWIAVHPSGDVRLHSSAPCHPSGLHNAILFLHELVIYFVS